MKPPHRAPTEGAQDPLAHASSPVTLPPPREARLQWMLMGAGVLAYAALSHYSESSPQTQGLATALSVGPILLIGLVLAWRWISPWAALACTAAVCACLYRFWSVIQAHYALSDLVQQCAAYGFVALGFGRSLFGGRVPLCTQLAITMHGDLTPAEVRYTYRATVAWLIFYVLLAMAILALFFTVPMSTWSLFVNFGTFALILLGGIVDHLLRRRLLPRHPGGGLLAIVQRALMG